MVADTLTKSDADVLIDKIRESSSDLREQVAANETLGKLSPVTVDTLVKIGVLTALTPAKYGGADLCPYDALRVFEELSYVDCSIGWVGMIPGVHGKNLLLLEPEARDKLATNGFPFIAGQGAPTGRAVEVDGGYRISGRWSYGSGLLHADMADGFAVLMENGQPANDENGQPILLLFFTSIENVTVGGNWDVLGLKATGSVDYFVEDIFVPAEHAVHFTFDLPLGDGQDRLFGIVAWLLSFHCAAALGAGRRILHELGDHARKPGRGGQRLADNPRFAHRFAKAEAAYRGARAYLYDTMTGVQKRIDRGQATTRADLTNIRAACLLLHDVNVETATFALRESGGYGLRVGPLQHVYRDIMAMGQHILAGSSGWVECAKDFLGEADDMSWSLYQLV